MIGWLQVTYKKLLNGTPTFGDLEDAQPSLARGLKALRDYQGDDLEVVFCRTFEVEYRVFDQARRPLALCVTAWSHAGLGSHFAEWRTLCVVQ